MFLSKLHDCQKNFSYTGVFIFFSMGKRGFFGFWVKYQFHKNFISLRNLNELVTNLLNSIKHFFARPIFYHKKVWGVQEVESNYLHKQQIYCNEKRKFQFLTRKICIKVSHPNFKNFPEHLDVIVMPNIIEFEQY